MTTLSLHLPIFFKHTPGLRVEKGSKIVLIALFCLALSLLGVYLFQAGELTRSGYLLKSHRAKVEKLSSQNLSLQGQSINLLSLQGIEEKIKDLDFIKVSEIKYIPISADYLVKRSVQK